MPSKSDQVCDHLATGMYAADIAKKVGCATGLVYVIKSHTAASERIQAVRADALA